MSRTKVSQYPLSHFIQSAATIALLTGLMGCGAFGQDPKVDSEPLLGSGIATEHFDTAVGPGDDFYQYVNGKWLDSFEIPADKSNFGSFTKLADEAEENLVAIIKEAAAGTNSPGSNADKIATAYNTFMDSAVLESAGATPLAEELKKISHIQSTESLIKRFGYHTAMGMTSPLVAWVDQDAKDTNTYIVYFHQGGLGLPDRDYYLKKDEKFAGYRKAYVDYIENLLKLGGESDASANAQAQNVMSIESSLAQIHWSRVQNRDRDKTYNKLTMGDLQEVAPMIPWARYFGALGLPTGSSFIIRQPSYVRSLSQVVSATELEAWKSYLRFALLNEAAPYLSKAFVDLNFDFYSKTLRGIEENRPRWKRGVAHVEGLLGEALGQLYVKRHFKPESKARMVALVDNLREAFRVGIDGLEWMGTETKKEAQTKLAKFTTKIGYPDTWRDYSALEVKSGDLWGNVLRGRVFEHERNMKKLGGPVDRNEWFMTPQTVNAYYNPPMNEIVFPAAILQPPFFNVEADDAVNYGAIGAVIGHEFSHGFDDQGRKSDGEGNLRDWWTEEDAKEFAARAEKLVAQYDKFAPFDDAKVNGKLTLGENIGDLGGLTIAYKAYKISLKGKKAPVIDGFTGDQRFFLGWAQIWRRKYREAELRRRLLTDPHSPSRARVLGILPNMPEFYAAFAIKEGDAIYLAPEDRVKIW